MRILKRSGQPKRRVFIPLGSTVISKIFYLFSVMSTAELVAKLKDEGNVFFLKKDYASAAAKYTEAIKIDGENAILYSNRAACRLNLKTYIPRIRTNFLISESFLLDISTQRLTLKG